LRPDVLYSYVQLFYTVVCSCFIQLCAAFLYNCVQLFIRLCNCVQLFYTIGRSCFIQYCAPWRCTNKAQNT